MEEDEPRFGFSVMGGEDEGFRPRVDEVSMGEWIVFLGSDFFSTTTLRKIGLQVASLGYGICSSFTVFKTFDSYMNFQNSHGFSIHI